VLVCQGADTRSGPLAKLMVDKPWRIPLVSKCSSTVSAMEFACSRHSADNSYNPPRWSEVVGACIGQSCCS